MSQPSLLDASLLDEMGGEAMLKMVIDRFIDRVFDDAMIGFFFAAADRARIKQKEYELAAATLGAQVTYTGQPIGAAHRRHPIQDGHFARRLEILRQTLQEFEVPARVAQHWLEHNAQLRSVVVRGDDPACGPGPGSEGGKP
jgi:hemoglobin